MTRDMSRRVAFGALLVVAGTIPVKILGAVREVLLAREFGVSDDIDAFLIAYSLPIIVFAVVAVAVPSAFIPVFLRTRAESGEDAAQRVFVQSLLIAFVGGVVLALLASLLRAPLVDVVGSNFSEPKKHFTESLVPLFSVLLPLGSVAAVCTAALQVNERFMRAALVPVVTPFVVVALLISLTSPSIRLLVAATVISGAIEMVILLALVQSSGLRFFGTKRVFDLDRHVNGMLSQVLPLLAFATLTNLGYVVDQAFAATEPAGSVATLAYANRIPLLITALVLSALGAVVLPKLSNLAIAGDRDALLAFVRRQMPLVTLSTVCVMGILFAVSHPLVELLFGSDQITAGVVDHVAFAQQMYLLQIPFFAINVIAVRAVSAALDNWTAAAIGGVTFVVNLVLDAVLVGRYGINGIAFASALTQMILVPIVLGALWRRSSHRIAEVTSV